MELHHDLLDVGSECFLLRGYVECSELVNAWDRTYPLTRSCRMRGYGYVELNAILVPFLLGCAELR